MTIYIGIDPGLSGAVVALDGGGRVISIQDVPTVHVRRGSKNRRAYVEAQMATLMRALAQQGSSVVALENVHAMPKQGVTSMFSMGVGVGIWRGILATLFLPYELIEPAVWKRAMKIPAGGDKGSSVVRALQLFPRAAEQIGKNHNRADALLLAEHLRRLRSNAGFPPPEEMRKAARGHGMAMRHGVNCPKVPHAGIGHLHGEQDDGPYDVDGVAYCGRCHAALG